MNWGQQIINEIRRMSGSLETRLSSIRTVLNDIQRRLTRLENTVSNLDDEWLNAEAEYKPAVEEVLDAATQPQDDPMQEVLDIFNSPKQKPWKPLTVTRAAEIITAAPHVELMTIAGKTYTDMYITVYQKGRIRVHVSYSKKRRQLRLTRVTTLYVPYRHASYQDLRDLGVPEEVLQAVRNKLVGASESFYPPRQEK